MKTLKTIVCLTLCAILAAALFAGCTNGKKNSAQQDPEAVFTRILNEVKFAETLEDSTEYAEYSIGELPENVAAKIYTGSGRNADCAMLFTAENAEELSAVEGLVKEYLASMKDEAQHYDPEQVPKIENAVFHWGEKSLIVCVTADTETVNAILN